ncbi:MAG: TlpA disulfide reductase family protein, partial [Flavobacteriales bacterium]|nr:TlpA disulfide reductase family protein [Flavobacteriales bacterium]
MKQILKWAFLVFILLCAFFSLTQVRKNVISGTVEGLKTGDKVLLASFHNSIKEFVVDDSTVVKKDGEFTIKTYDKNEVVHLYFIPQGDTLNIQRTPYATVFMEGLGKYTVSATMEQLRNAKVEGGVYQYPEVQKMDSLKTEQKNIQKQFPQAYKENDTTAIKNLYTQMNALNMACANMEKDIITKYKDTRYAAYLLVNRSMVLEEENKTEIDSLLQNLGEDSQKSLYGRNVKKRLANFSASSVNGQAPDFTLTTTEGDTLRLSDYAGKVVLLEFWASWCAPCRANNPHLVQLYQKYHPMGLSVVGIACWDDQTAWKKAIEADGLLWAQVKSDEKIKGQDDVADLYVISGVPTTVIVGTDGKVIYRGHPSKVEEKLME